MTRRDSSPRPLVCLLREPDLPDPYAAALAGAGFDTCFAPVLRFEWVNQDRLRNVLGMPDRYAGLILTSPRAVAALAGMIETVAVYRPAWECKPFFVVGPRTAEAVRDLGFLPEGEGAGTAEALFRRHIVQQPVERPLLFLSGNRRRETLPDLLAQHGIPFDELCVYETHVRQAPTLDTTKAVRWLVFFSPSGIEAVQDAAAFHPLDYKIAAIGPTTAGALEETGWPVSAVAATPTPEGLATALRNVEGI